MNEVLEELIEVVAAGALSSSSRTLRNQQLAVQYVYIPRDLPDRSFMTLQCSSVFIGRTRNIVNLDGTICDDKSKVLDPNYHFPLVADPSKCCDKVLLT